MAADSDAPTFCLTIPSGRWNLAAIVGAIHRYHPDSPVVATWCGDPHRRPPLDSALGVRWADIELPAPHDFGWGRLLCALGPREYECVRTCASIVRLMDRGHESIVVLRVGSTAVLGAIPLTAVEEVVTLVPRTPSEVPNDGLAPTPRDQFARGMYSTAMAVYRTGAKPFLKCLIDDIVLAGAVVGQALERTARRFPIGVCGDPDWLVGGWSVGSTLSPRVLDLDDLGRGERWRFDFDPVAARIRLSQHPELAATVTSALPQLEGDDLPLTLPGGICVDGAVRRILSRTLADAHGRSTELPPEPFGPTTSVFLRWLEEPSPEWGPDFGRYWRELRLIRPDLCAAFPRSESFDQRRYVDWIGSIWRTEGRSVLMNSSSRTPRAPLVDSDHDRSGVNVVGYHSFDLSLGYVARSIVSAFSSADVPVGAIDHHRTGSPLVAHPPVTTRELRFATNLAVVNADQFEFLVAERDNLLDRRRTIGYWFWELEQVPHNMVAAIDFVDDIWVGSRFVERAFRAVTDKPVHHVPIPVDEPRPSHRLRHDLGLPADRYIFVVTFDHFSVAERKNPFGAIDAFRRAFAENEGPLLVVKTTNGHVRWQNHERVLLAAAGRRDIIVWDEHLSRSDQMAVVAQTDCLVSLHRSEGLGLHCAEAMWLGRPVIATRYSGNLDFMDDSCSALIDCGLTSVRHGEGVYPETAMWADPDLDQAADWMRRLADDPATGTALGAKARERMQQQPSLADTGRLMARLAGIHRGTGNDHDGTASS